MVEIERGGVVRWIDGWVVDVEDVEGIYTKKGVSEEEGRKEGMIRLDCIGLDEMD